MELLVKSTEIVCIADHIDFGIFDEPDVEKWAMYDENNNVLYYAIDGGFEKVTYDGEVPEDIYTYGKYIYNNGEVVLNPNYVEPPKPEVERLDDIESALNALAGL